MKKVSIYLAYTLFVFKNTCDLKLDKGTDVKILDMEGKQHIIMVVIV